MNIYKCLKKILTAKKEKQSLVEKKNLADIISVLPTSLSIYSKKAGTIQRSWTISEANKHL